MGPLKHIGIEEQHAGGLIDPCDCRGSVRFQDSSGQLATLAFKDPKAKDSKHKLHPTGPKPLSPRPKPAPNP